AAPHCVRCVRRNHHRGQCVCRSDARNRAPGMLPGGFLLPRVHPGMPSGNLTHKLLGIGDAELTGDELGEERVAQLSECAGFKGANPNRANYRSNSTVQSGPSLVSKCDEGKLLQGSPGNPLPTGCSSHVLDGVSSEG